MKELLNAYIDNLLSDKERAAVEAHIASCPSCMKELDELAQAVNVVKKLDRIVPPPWFSEQVMINIKKEEDRKKGIISRLFSPLYIKLPLEAFATVVIAVLAIYSYRALEPESKHLIYSPQAVQESSAPAAPTARDKIPETGTREADKMVQTLQSPGSEKVSGLKKDIPQMKPEEKAVPAPEAKGSVEPEKKQAAPSAARKDKNEIQYDLESPGPQSMEKSKEDAAGGIGKSLAKAEEQESSAAPAPQVQMRAAPSPVMIDVSVTVADKDKAIRDISSMLDAMKARVIGKYSSGTDTAILAETKGADTKKIIEKLGTSGDVSLITRYPDVSGSSVVMRIKVISRQPQVKP